MKKFLLINLILLSSITFNSCQEDTESVTPVVEDNVPNGQVKGSLAVQVMPSSEKAKVSGLSGAEVTVMQGGVQKVTTDETGIAVFNNLSVGEVAIFIKKDGYSTYNTTAYIGSEGGIEAPFSDSNHVVFATKQVYLPRKGASVLGTFIGDFDFDNFDSPSPSDSGDYKAGIQVRIEYANKYIQPNVYYVSTNSNSAFSLSNLPEGEATISVRHYEKRTIAPEGGKEYQDTYEYFFSDVFNLKADETLDLGTRYIYPFGGYEAF